MNYIEQMKKKLEQTTIQTNVILTQDFLRALDQDPDQVGQGPVPAPEAVLAQRNSTERVG